MKFTSPIYVILLVYLLASCGSRKQTVPSQASAATREKTEPSQKSYGISEDEDMAEKQVYQVIENAKAYLGTSYKYGGSTEEGMDCSGLVFTAFLKEDISLPRSSRDMSLLGDRLNLDEVTTGDLLFFETDKKKKVINHVGLVVELEADKIFFIHSTTSRGVIISTMDENYWQEHFVMARRIQIN